MTAVVNRTYNAIHRITSKPDPIDGYPVGYWETVPIEGGCEYSLESLRHDPEGKGSWVVIPETEHGDYAGNGSVGAANYADIAEDYADHADIAFVYGSYGYQAVIYNTETTDQDILDMVAGLEDYPLISEDTHSRIEMEWVDEAWELWGESDYRRALVKMFTGDLLCDEQAEEIDRIEAHIDAIPSDKLREVFEAAREEANVYWENEYSGMHIDIDRVVAKTTAEDLGL